MAEDISKPLDTTEAKLLRIGNDDSDTSEMDKIYSKSKVIRPIEIALGALLCSYGDKNFLRVVESEDVIGYYIVNEKTLVELSDTFYLSRLLAFFKRDKVSFQQIEEGMISVDAGEKYVLEIITYYFQNSLPVFKVDGFGIKLERNH